MIDFAGVAAAALNRAGELLPRWLPTGHWEGHEWVALNPGRADRHPGSFKVNRLSGRWSDFATGDKGRDLISLYALLNGGLPQAKAASNLAAELGLSQIRDHVARRKGHVLRLEELAKAKGFDVSFLKQCGVEQSGRYVRFNYYLADGSPAPRYRLRRALDGKDRFLWSKGHDRIVPYGLSRLDDARAADNLYFVEGETDALTLWLHGYAAIGMPGADMSKLIQPEHLQGISNLHIVREPDEGGVTFVSRMRSRLSEMGFAGTVRVLAMPDEIKDPNAMHVRLLDRGGFKVEFEKLSRAAESVELTSPSIDQMDEGAGSETRPPEFSDEEIALEFAAAHRDDLRYVASWTRWLTWDGGRWSDDKTLQAFDEVRKFCRLAAARVIEYTEEATKAQRLAAAIASAKTVAAVHSLVRADRRLAATDSQWDLNPILLNTPGGTVDLETGQLRSHNRGDHLTRRTATTPTDAICCPRWLEALEQIFDGDRELIEYVQRAAGYSLTGLVSEQVLFFLFGWGGNGKNIVAETLAGVLCDYAVVAPMSLLLEQRHEQHPTELAVLRGARMALGSEVDPGRGWAEAKLKALTGGDRITARLMRGDFFEFTPQFKFWLRANHKPRLRTVDAAMRRRMHLVPFRVQFTGRQQDPNLREKLRAEWAGILRWAIEGCMAWQKIGLKPPISVHEATETYFADFDVLDRWLGDCCVQDVNGQVFSRQLFRSWHDWAERNNERVGAEAEFVERLEARGFKRFRNSNGRGFQGIVLSAGRNEQVSAEAQGVRNDGP
jgi:putative DNA primase/helicase